MKNTLDPGGFTPVCDVLDEIELDALGDTISPAKRFLRKAWYTAGASPAECIVGLRDADGRALVAIPLSTKRIGPIPVREIAGGYWPYRSCPMDPEIDDTTLSSLFSDSATSRTLGALWRFGPVVDDDEAVAHIKSAARQSGWTVLSKDLGTVFEIDVAKLRGDGDWPSNKTRRKNRWRKRRMAENSELQIRYFSGADWTQQDRDDMAEIEANSWLADLADGGDTKFADRDERHFWKNCCKDPALAEMVFGSIMSVGSKPVAFTFGIETGSTRYYIANNYDQKLRKFGPGRVLLYDDFERAAHRGVKLISWGAGDAGYKSEMGAQAGPKIHDLLFVRNKALAIMVRPLWER